MLYLFKKITSKYVIIMIYMSFILSNLKIESLHLIIILLLFDIFQTVLFLYVEEIIFCKDRSVWESIKIIFNNLVDDFVFFLILLIILYFIGKIINDLEKNYNLERFYKFFINVGYFLILYQILIDIKFLFIKNENKKIEKKVIEKIRKENFFYTIDEKYQKCIFKEVHMKINNISRNIDNNLKNDECTDYLDIVNKIILDEQKKENNNLIKQIFKNYKLILSLVILCIIGIISGFSVREEKIFQFLTFDNLKTSFPILYFLLIIII